MCTFGLSGCRVKPRRLRGRRCFTRQPKNSKRAHFTAPAIQTPPKFHEKHPERHRNSETVAGKGKKKSEILGPPPFGAPPFRGPTLSGPHPFGAPPFWAPPFWAPPFWAPPKEAETPRRPLVETPGRPSGDLRETPGRPPRDLQVRGGGGGGN